MLSCRVLRPQPQRPSGTDSHLSLPGTLLPSLGTLSFPLFLPTLNATPLVGRTASMEL